MSDRKRRQKKQRKKSASRGPLGGRAEGTATLQLFSFEITDEPMPGAAERNLSPELLDQLDDLTERVHAGSPGEHLDEIQTMLELCPQIPRLHNYLSRAYENLGRWDEARQVIENTCRRFPDYVFGITNYVMFCLEEGNVEEAGRVLNKRYSICQFARGRRKFHQSEVVCYQATVGLYLCAIGEYEHAMSHAEMLVELAPDHVHVWRLLVKLYEHREALSEDNLASLFYLYTQTAAGSMASSSA